MDTDQVDEATLDGLEIGATGQAMLQLVLTTATNRVRLLLSAEEARWLAYALTHWADMSEKPESSH
jgi:hypothetical protein